MIWDSVQHIWSDTTVLVEQSVEPFQAGLKFVEITRVRQPAGMWAPVRRNEVFNPIVWTTNQKTAPDSTFHFTWDSGLGDWTLQKKIVYAKDSADYVTQRSTFLSGHSIADTLEQFWVDDYWDQLWSSRMVFNEQNNLYKLLDSTAYAFVNDTFCPTTVIYDYQSGEKKPFRRYKFEFFNTLDNYELVTDHWSEEVNFWQAFLKENQIVVPNELRIANQYETRTSAGYKVYRRSQRYYDSDWDPLKFDTQYLPSLETFPDSVIRKNYLKDNNTGLISTIIEQIQPKYEYELFFNRFKWEFAFGAVPTVSAVSPVPLVPKILVSSLSGGVYQIDIGQDTQVIQAQLRLFDASGRQLKTWKVTNSFTKIDISHYPAGVYYLNIVTGHSSQTVPLSVY